MKNNKIHINEATTTNTGGRGSYIVPLEPGLRKFKKDTLAPFTDSVSDYEGNIINKIPKGKNKLGIVPVNEWVNIDDIIIEGTNSEGSAGEYNGPIELGLKKWNNTLLSPFNIIVKNELNKVITQKKLKNNNKRVVGVWEKGPDGTYNNPTHDVHTIKEWIEINDDLTVENLFKRPKSSITSTTNKKTSQNESFEVRIKNYLLEFVKNRY
jgi:hypothetical protein